MTVKIEDVNQGDSGSENNRRSLYVGGHSNAGRREVHGKQNVVDCVHGFGSHSRFKKRLSWIDAELQIARSNRILQGSRGHGVPRLSYVPPPHRLCSFLL